MQFSYSVETIHELTPARLVQAYSAEEGFCCLGLGSATGPCLVFCDPVLKVEVKNGHGQLIWHGGSTAFATPWECLSTLDEIHSTQVDNKDMPPITAGFFAYEFLRFIENVDCTFDPEFPDACFFIYSKVYEFQHQEKDSVTVHALNFSKYPSPFWHSSVAAVDQKIQQQTASTNINTAELAAYSSDARDVYLSKVRDIRAQIFEGDVYQVNLTQQFSLPAQGLDAGQVFLESQSVTPANYSGFLKLRSSALICASPERFFTQRGSSILCSPIKGTRPRGIDQVSELSLIRELQSSEKDLSELAMIVDLVRNDLGRIAEVGSVCVENHARLETLPQVHHLVSDVSAELNPECQFTDIVRALFPCGSITGTPKIAAMQSIEVLEEHPRRLYTGSLGCLGPNMFADFNVAIRSGIIQNDSFIINAGGGIVIDSDPEQEYEECLVKASSLFRAWRAAMQSK